MSKPQVTITLGRTGRKVVKRPQTVSDRTWTDSQPLSGGRRSTSDRYISADGSWLPSNKRLRGNFPAQHSGYNRVHDPRIGRNDLRLKLMRKKQLKRKESEVEVRNNMDQREKMSITLHPIEASLLRRNYHTYRADQMLQAESSRKYYPFHTRAGLQPRSPEKVMKIPREIFSSEHDDGLRQVPPRRASDASRTGRIFENNALSPSRTTGPAPVTTIRANYDTGKPITGPPPASGFPNTYIGNQPLTVSSLLHALGLGKYAILFQAEEVDMAALKQMRDLDLKQLGIPMGPRKKILLALFSCSQRQPLR